MKSLESMTHFHRHCQRVSSQNYNCESNQKGYQRPAQIIIFLALSSLIFFETGIICLSSYLQIFYYNCVKFHQYLFICLVGVALMRNMDWRTISQTNCTGWLLYTAQNTLFAGVLLKKQGSPEDGYIPRLVFFVNILFFSSPDWYIEPDQNCTLPLVKNGKIGKLFDLVWSWHLRYGSGSRSLHIILLRTTFIPS